MVPGRPGGLAGGVRCEGGCVRVWGGLEGERVRSSKAGSSAGVGAKGARCSCVCCGDWNTVARATCVRGRAVQHVCRLFMDLVDLLGSFWVAAGAARGAWAPAGREHVCTANNCKRIRNTLRAAAASPATLAQRPLSNQPTHAAS